MKKKLLIISATRQLYFQKNMERLINTLENDLPNFSLLTNNENLSHKLIVDYLKAPAGMLPIDHKISTKELTNTCVVFQTSKDPLLYINIYLFLKKNGFKKALLIFRNNQTQKLNLEKINKFIDFYLPIMRFYRRLGF